MNFWNNRHLLTLLFFIILWPPSGPPVDFWELPAIVSVYDPTQCDEPGWEINCDDDPEHFASGLKVDPEWFGRAAACDERLLGRTVEFPGIPGQWLCVDTGGAIGERWSEYYDRQVMVFDLMVDLSDGYPEWTYWLWSDWDIIGASPQA